MHFLQCINDLSNYLSRSTAGMFVDDTNLTTSGSSIADVQSNLNEDLEHIHQWLLSNKLTLNKEKTEYMIVGSRPRLNKINNDLEIELGGNNIKRVKETKTLGVIVDDQLNWQTHLDSIVTLETLTCCKRVETTRTFVLVVDTAKVCSTRYCRVICFWRVVF